MLRNYISLLVSPLLCKSHSLVQPDILGILYHILQLYQFVFIFRMFNALMTAILIGQYHNLVDTGRQNKSLP